MASTYTANSGIEKIGAGEQAGTWGTTTNNNLDILDRAINGVGAITLSGTTHTLTTSDGTLSDGGFKNRGNVKPQTGPSRIKVTQEAKRLAGSAINKLPITPEEKTSDDQKTLNKFNNFIKSLSNIK